MLTDGLAYLQHWKLDGRRFPLARPTSFFYVAALHTAKDSRSGPNYRAPNHEVLRLSRVAGSLRISPAGSNGHPIKRKSGARWGPRQTPAKRLKLAAQVGLALNLVFMSLRSKPLQISRRCAKCERPLRRKASSSCHPQSVLPMRQVHPIKIFNYRLMHS